MTNVVGFTLLTTTGKLNYQLFKSDASSSDFELQFYNIYDIKRVTAHKYVQKLYW